MPARTRLPGQTPDGQELPLAAFRASLAGYDVPTSFPPMMVDVITAGMRIGCASGIEVGTLTSRSVEPRDDGGAADDVVTAEEFVPPEEWCWTEVPDPDTGCPPGLSEAELRAQTVSVAGPQMTAWPEGIVPPNGFMSPPVTQGGPGFGFGEGEPLDTLVPSAALAALAEDAHGVLGRIDDDCLIGVIRGWRRIASWAAGRELAAVAELARRRPADGLPGSGREFVADEVAAALTLTGRAAQDERDLAWQLANVLPATLRALGEGRIDLAKARVIAVGTAELDPGHAAAVEAAVLARAPGWTTGQLRAAVARAVLAADPAAASRQREAAQARAHVSCYTGQAGTGHLEGHDLPPAQTLAADARLGQIARSWKAQAAQGGMDLLRAHAYLALLLGHDTATPPPSLLPPGLVPGSSAPGPSAAGPSATPGPSAPGFATPGPSAPGFATPGPSATPDFSASDPAACHSGGGPDGDSDPTRPPDGGRLVPAGLRAPEPEPGYGVPPLAAMINLTVPLDTLLQFSDAPGEVAGYGPVAANTARALVGAAAGHSATRWQLTVTGPYGHALGHGAARGPGRGGGTRDGWTVTVTARPLATGDCDHHDQEPGYRPSPALARLIRARTTTCCYPGCRRPAVQCDLDHTIPYEDGGLTCQCNLAPLCRRHHRLKQAEGWTLQQPSPGVLIWLTPAGRRYTTLPSQHPT